MWLALEVRVMPRSEYTEAVGTDGVPQEGEDKINTCVMEGRRDSLWLDLVVGAHACWAFFCSAFLSLPFEYEISPVSENQF